MRIDSAIALIDQVVYKPGYSFTATDHSKRFEGTIKVHVAYSAVETGRANAADGYQEVITTYAEFPIMVGDVQDAICLYRRLIEAILLVEAHEAREALRVNPTLWAPFHPHAIDGMKAWRRTADDATPAELMSDFQFGIA